MWKAPVPCRSCLSLQCLGAWGLINSLPDSNSNSSCTQLGLLCMSVEGVKARAFSCMRIAEHVMVCWVKAYQEAPVLCFSTGWQVLHLQDRRHRQHQPTGHISTAGSLQARQVRTLLAVPHDLIHSAHAEQGKLATRLPHTGWCTDSTDIFFPKRHTVNVQNSNGCVRLM